MALGLVARAALLVSTLGALAFILGIMAENKKPESVASTTVNGITICHYPSDASISLGAAAVAVLFVTTCVALVALFFPYDGKHIPHGVLWKNAAFTTFFVLSLAVYLTAEGLLLWTTISESMHHKQNKHYHLAADGCPTAKTGLFGGAAFLALDSTLFWLICLMLLGNAREDHFGMEDEASMKGIYAEIPHDSTVIPPANKV
ncbi:hypothetical protein SELMODRAFT_164273 [Selaginella moellendorffii]|uniref:Uncharacterized protein n=1 Tax=Selaginella moellendorffii TaxID=88036 RepID=D8QN80_SELML|nr:uncharacterized protein LOC9642262 [Selaginella moellendorffii]EFJ38059.1 hypothetical protein SELMODRAFT_164273 [Selaginella moellendorffii]|eukprot:XP_002960520.1 uncharacterized protein LOC9642262 [Selaginella moellendorffii]